MYQAQADHVVTPIYKQIDSVKKKGLKRRQNEILQTLVYQFN